ncbi:cell death abnormality protein 1-like [Haliotis rubra]|uniref:cell death abnormality protein 1-like n=1 Tax=Haliotis rubra TaxID=36100 RepID=UPI001EE564BE|nr:cell death abnormality protein 1-like [Haliotis rubra]
MVGASGTYTMQCKTGFPARTIMCLLMFVILQLSVPAHAQGPCPKDKYGNCLHGNCTRTAAGRTECAKGCVRGFWGTECRIPCPEHCEACNRYDGTCFICSGDVYGQYCNITCDAMCHGFRCNKHGSCFSPTCQDRWYGSNCRKQCNQTFLKCGKIDGECITCKDGFYGMNCELGCNKYGLAEVQLQETRIPGCSNDSPTDHELEGYHMCTGKLINCINDNCTRTQSVTTVCAAGCVEGFWGTSCRIPCPENCQTCERLVGNCTKCKDNLYGIFCNIACQEQCHECRCNQAGTCSDTVCTDGRYGDECIRECRERYKACNRYTGLMCEDNDFEKSECSYLSK